MTGAQPSGPEPTGPDREVLWLGPLADRAVHDERADPGARAAARAGVRLALVAAMQHLTGPQCAVFILRDVLAWRAAEVAELLDLSVAAVNSHLQRARRRISELGCDDEVMSEPADLELRHRVEAYANALGNSDVNALAGLLRDDVTLEMPPTATWFRGAVTVVDFLRPRLLGGAWRTLGTAANTQPSVALYLGNPDGSWRLESIHVLDLAGGLIARIVIFRDPADFAAFALPATMSSEAPAGLPG